MIKQFISRVLGRKKPDLHNPRIFRADKHKIDHGAISAGAIRVCEGLHAEGYKAFVVGGAVRDLMLGRQPKDFDVATDATPEQVRAVFRRARIIGRRFRLVHVMFGQETVEVSTFRANHERSEADEDDARADEHGRLLRDNVFGSQEEDAIRRDFTVNALFYDPERDEVWDYLSGVDDLKARRLVMIGDPEARYREDPVRMLRAARLAAKLEFRIDAKTEAPISRLAPLLDNVPAARLFDELLKMLLSGQAAACLARLRALGLHRNLLPFLDELFKDDSARRFVELALARTDERIAADKGVSPAFLLAALLWPLVDRRIRAADGGTLPQQVLWHEAMDGVLEAQRRFLAIPRKLDATMKELWVAQPRFLQRGGGRPYRLLTHPRFRACYDFLVLRAEAGDVPMELADWWTRFQDADEDMRKSMLLQDDGPKKKRRRRGRRTGGGGRNGLGEADAQGETNAQGEQG
ncbi:MAG: polynucleotide adenylyltransferase PcnB [Betaproteobacteria bacterium]|nr:polynucleotide adenylyltransferase PcnB [Betaproteobacteria bacterium]